MTYIQINNFFEIDSSKTIIQMISFGDNTLLYFVIEKKRSDVSFTDG